MTKITIDIKTCKECPLFKEGPMQSTDGWDRGYDWLCTAKKNKVIAGFVEWHEESKIPVPDWCPKRVKKKE